MLHARSQNDEAGFVPAHARFPVTVRRSTSNLLVRISTSAAGALLVTLPAIVGTGVPVQFKIASAMVGAALLAVATVIFGSTR